MINLIEDFYDSNDFGLITVEANFSQYKSTYQPAGKYFTNRLKAYPCYETNTFFDNNSLLVNIFINTFHKKTNYKIKKIETLFRKIYSKELKTIFEYKLSPHQDPEKYDFAGVVYLNSWSLKDGTALYSFREQIEPDLIIGSKPNRCVFYSSGHWHSPCQDPETEMRIVQPFFITLEK
jgi:hypothetical protein